MANYSASLGLVLPNTGEYPGTWGTVANDYLTKYIDAAVAGTQTISGSQTAVTLSTTTGSTLTQAGSGSTGSAQYMVINCTGNPASLLTITAPATSKIYIILNATSTNQSVKIVATGPTTGVTVPAGDKAFVAWNGSDFVRVGASAGGSTTQIQYNNSGNLGGSANFTFDGSNVQIGSQGDLRFGDSDNSNWVAFQAPTTVVSNITWTLPSADGTSGQLLSTNGTGTLSWTSPVSSAAGSDTQVQYNSSGSFAASSNFTFNGTTATINTLNLTNALGVSYGGTGVTSATAYAVLTGGTTSTGAFQTVSGVGTAGQVLTSNGAGTLPSWQTATGGVSKGQSLAFALIFGL